VIGNSHMAQILMRIQWPNHTRSKVVWNSFDIRLIGAQPWATGGDHALAVCGKTRLFAEISLGRLSRCL
jgi:hypothetical protein